MALLHAAPDATIVVDDEGTIVYANHQTEVLFGWSHTELIGRAVEDLLPERFRASHPGLRDSYARQPSARPMGIGLTLAARKRDASEIPIEISLSPIETRDGTLYAAAIRDVTERVQMEAERQEQVLAARQEQSHRLESLGQLAGGIAHDFNNLLGVILGYVALASRQDDISSVRADLGVIRQAADRAADLTKQLLAFGRRDHVNPEVVNVQHLLGEFAELMRRTLGDEIEVEVEVSVPSSRRSLRVMADRSRLEQVLLNLAINARDAMPDGGVLRLSAEAVTIGTGPAIDEPELSVGPYIRIRVSDTGSGMPPQVIEHVFEPFFTTKPRGEGTGLGLASAYGIVIRSGGTITVDSEVGTGTTMTILLPAAIGDDLEGLDDAAAAAATLGRVLIVEDEEALRSVTARMLGEAGYEVVTAPNGLLAIEVLAADPNRFDLVLTDVTMPKVSGPELAREIARRWPYTKVLFMTGYAEPLTKIDESAHLLSKPFTEQDLLDAVATAMAD